MAWMSNPHDSFMRSGKQQHQVHVGNGQMANWIGQPVCEPPLFTRIRDHPSLHPVQQEREDSPLQVRLALDKAPPASIHPMVIYQSAAVYLPGHVETNIHRW